MKKLLLFCLIMLCMEANAQTDYYPIITGGSTSGNGRAPQGSQRYNRSMWLITAAEMSASGFTAGSVINSLGFTYLTAQSIATTGNMTVYLQNTADVTNTKSATWATAITGMTTASNSSITIPAVTGGVDFAFAGGTTFTYTGGALYIAFDYQNIAGTLSTGNVAACNTALTSGLKGAISTTANPTTVTASNFRPETRLGKSVVCARPTNLGFNTPTSNSANVTFTVTGGMVDLEYGAYNFTPGTGTTVANITSAYTITGLAPSTAYDYYLRKDCGAGNLSIWEGPFPVHTTFFPTNTSYTTGFEQADFPYIGWLATPDNTANAWFINYGGLGNALVQEGESAALAITPAAAAANERMFSRGVNLTAGSSTTITYYVRNYQNASTGTASYVLSVGTDQTAGSQTTILATETGLSNTAFVQKTYNFTPSVTGTYYFSFLHNSPLNAAGTHALIIDNFNVTEVLSIKDFLSSKFSIYPNPSKNIINISNSDNILINNIKITDINGRSIKSLSMNNVTDAQINISELTSGIYFMNIDTNEGSAIKKIVKE